MTGGFLVETPPLSVFEHMAFDELSASNGKKKFILRFYSWKKKAVTFGYAQNANCIMKNLPEKCEITRRPTGGGVVFHNDDITFSAIFPICGRFNSDAIYYKLHGSIYKALAARKVRCRLSLGGVGSGYMPDIDGKPTQCFVNPVKNDLLDDTGKKVLGGAIRRFENIVLYQGSLRLENARIRMPEFKLSIMKELALSWNLKWRVHRPSEIFSREVKDLAENKYNNKEWIYRF